jgi:1,2-diacylglycerol 3-beta-galactosyltransferase
MTAKTKLTVLYTDAGGGHRATALALKGLLEGTHRYQVTLLNPYREVFPQLDLFSKLTGISGENIYNRFILQRGHTGALCWLFYVALKLNYLVTQRPAARVLARYFHQTRPDMVVSVMPLGNQVMLSALATLRKQLADGRDRQAAVLITDWTEMLGGLWFPSQSNYHAICGTKIAAQQARRLAGGAPQVHAMSGLLIRPEFPAARRAPASKAALGLDPGAPVVTVLFGAEGSARMLELASALTHLSHGAQLVFICGRNTELADRLRHLSLPYPAHILGFSDALAAYLSVSDLFIGKPGPGCVSEALAVGVPMLLDRSQALPQEKSVVDEVQASGYATAFASLEEFRRAFRHALAAIEDGSICSDFPENTSAQDLIAIFQAIQSEAAEGQEAAPHALEQPS